MMMIFFLLCWVWPMFSKKSMFYYYMGLLLTMIWLSVEFKFLPYLMFAGYYGDTLSFWLSFMTIIVSGVSWMAAGAATSSKQYMYLFSFMNTILIMSFFSKTPIIFYFWFEASLIPIFLIILGWGYQPERLFASKSMFLYTIFGSLPLLWMILMLSDSNLLPSFYLWNIPTPGMKSSPLFYSLMILSLVFSFLVKFPMYSLHLWLPKAHVEAPVGGSMVLAGILLKLGGFGIYRMAPLFDSNCSLINFLSFFSMMGGAWISFVCITQTDFKVLIAYSSVSHMSLAISTILKKTFLSALASKLMLICHGWTSVALFFSINVFYLRSNSRSMNLSKGLLTLFPMFSALWAAMCASNMGCPFSLNLFSEMLVFLSMMGTQLYYALPLALMGFLAAAYSLILYSSSSQGTVSSSLKLVYSNSLTEVSLMFTLFYLIFFSFLIILPLI